MNNTTESVNTTAQMINQEGLGTVILALFIVVFLVMQYMQWKQDKADREANEIANTILQKDAQIAKLEHEKKVNKRKGRQNTFWAATIGTTAGYLIAKK